VSDSDGEEAPPCNVYSEEDLMQWTSQDAVHWIARSGNAFEALGIPPAPCADSDALGRRFRKLALLTHPDKTAESRAAVAFQKLAEAMRVLSESEEQRRLLCRLFPRRYGEAEVRQGQAVAGFWEPSAEDEDAVVKASVELQKSLMEVLKEKKDMEEADKVERERWKSRGGVAENLLPKRKREDYPDNVPWGSDVKIPRTKPSPQFTPPSVPGAELCISRDKQSVASMMSAMAAKTAAPCEGLLNFAMPPPPSGFQARLLNAAAKVQGSAWPGLGAGIATPAAVLVPSAVPEEGGDPNLIWSLTGSAGLSSAGWQRMESRTHPGKFYFLHLASKRTVISKESERGRGTLAADAPPVPIPAGPVNLSSIVGRSQNLLPGWEMRESRKQPGAYYYANLTTGETRTTPPMRDNF